jgi:stage II sporulation protein D
MKADRVPSIEVGILKSERIRFGLNGEFVWSGGGDARGSRRIRPGSYEASVEGGTIRIKGGDRSIQEGAALLMEPAEPDRDRFLLRDVVIGIGFHWEQKEDQEFQGSLKLMVSGEQIQVVNIVALEEYLASVISSEMRADSSPELLKAHAIISRSWLLAQVERQRAMVGTAAGNDQGNGTEGEYIRWYSREDHDGFHVCADDHCQRYQGISRALNPRVEKAVRETAGQVLVYGGKICDARFSKCCGGVTELFESCWEPVPHPYLTRVDDNPASSPVNVKDLTVEANAVAFINSSPAAFCNTSDPGLLRQVLNDYDQASPDFFRWEVTLRQELISTLIREKSGMDFGAILDLIPVERGVSSRLVRLRIVGERMELVVGKELEIRRLLSDTHLYSSAFTVEKGKPVDGIPDYFILHGAGWGHGVGLCQIGAAVMADRGFSHRQILEHYFVDSNIGKRYE